jgi:hypothetical protein
MCGSSAAWRTPPRSGAAHLYLPARPDPAPLVVFMHGGGWLRGDRSMVSPRFASWRPGPLARLAADGFAVASVDYRLSGEARFPAQLEDVSAAVDWLTGQAAGGRGGRSHVGRRRRPDPALRRRGRVRARGHRRLGLGRSVEASSLAVGGAAMTVPPGSGTPTPSRKAVVR